MSEDEWRDSLRKRTHDLSNRFMETDYKITVLEQSLEEVKRSAVDLKARTLQLEILKMRVQNLDNQSHILRWVLGVFTVIMCGTVLHFLSL
jgi:hypothetical protein